MTRTARRPGQSDEILPSEGGKWRANSLDGPVVELSSPRPIDAADKRQLDPLGVARRKSREIASASASARARASASAPILLCWKRRFWAVAYLWEPPVHVEIWGNPGRRAMVSGCSVCAASGSCFAVKPKIDAML